jgi:hypothetical protein
MTWNVPTLCALAVLFLILNGTSPARGAGFGGGGGYSGGFGTPPIVETPKLPGEDITKATKNIQTLREPLEMQEDIQKQQQNEDMIRRSQEQKLDTLRRSTEPTTTPSSPIPR